VAEIVKVTTKGQLTLPARIRKDLGISKDTYLLAEEVGDFVVLRRAESRFLEISERFQRDAKRRGITREELLRALKGARRRRSP
jgi:AbrB family looped-hinge helix DNA binding protein